MTWSAVGSFEQAGFAGSGTISLNNQAVGDLILLAAHSIDSTTNYVSSVSGGGATWTQIGTPFTGSTNAMVATLWAGKVTATGAQTATLTVTGGSPTIRAAAQEFSSTVGAWRVDTTAHLDSAGTNTWPSLTPSAAGELYFGFAIDGTAAAGSTSGYTYQTTIPAQDNGCAFNPACGASATAPVWGDSGHKFGLMVLMQESRTFTVTATSGGAGAGGIAIQVEVLEGQPASFLGATAGVASSTPSVSITPQATGSRVYGMTTGLSASGTPTPLSGTTDLSHQVGGGLFYDASLSTGTTAGTPITQGYSGVTGVATVAMEVKGTTAGLDAANNGSTGTSVTSTAISAGAGALLVAIVGSNGGAGVTTMAITDTSGLGLTWTEQVKQNASGNGYVGVWTAVVPGSTYTLFGQVVNNMPGSPAADSSAYTMGPMFSVSQACTLKAIWFYSAAGATVLPATIALYSTTGGLANTLVHSETASWSGAAGSGWVRAAFSSPPSLSAGTNYQACVFNTSGSNWYSATAHFWDTGVGANGITNGPLTAPNQATVQAFQGGSGQDAFISASTLGFPNTAFNATNYWIDPEVSPSGAPPSSSPGLLMACYP